MICSSLCENEAFVLSFSFPVCVPNHLAESNSCYVQDLIFWCSSLVATVTRVNVFSDGCWYADADKLVVFLWIWVCWSNQPIGSFKKWWCSTSWTDEGSWRLSLAGNFCFWFQGLQDLKGVKELLDYLDLLDSQALVDQWDLWAHLQIYHTLSRADGAPWSVFLPCTAQLPLAPQLLTPLWILSLLLQGPPGAPGRDGSKVRRGTNFRKMGTCTCEMQAC